MVQHVKQAGISEAGVLSSLGAKTFYDTFRPYNSEEDMQSYISKAYAIETITTNLSNPNIHYFIYKADGVSAGYIKLIEHATYPGLTGKTIELEKIYVLASHFGTEAGHLLMQTAIHHSQAGLFDTLFLGVWEENKRAVRFYEKNGFEVFATREFQLGSRLCHDFMMKLDLKKAIQ